MNRNQKTFTIALWFCTAIVFAFLFSSCAATRKMFLPTQVVPEELPTIHGGELIVLLLNTFAVEIQGIEVNQYYRLMPKEWVWDTLLGDPFGFGDEPYLKEYAPSPPEKTLGNAVLNIKPYTGLCIRYAADTFAFIEKKVPNSAMGIIVYLPKKHWQILRWGWESSGKKHAMNWFVDEDRQIWIVEPQDPNYLTEWDNVGRAPEKLVRPVNLIKQLESAVNKLRVK